MFNSDINNDYFINGQTTNTTETTIFSVDLDTYFGVPSKYAVTVELKYALGKTDYSSAGAGVLLAGFVCDGTSVRLVGSNENESNFDITRIESVLDNTNLRFDVSGKNIVLKATGLASTTINWYGALRVTGGANI